MEEEESNTETNNDMLISNFDFSVDNFLSSMDSIRELCGFSGEDSCFEVSELERFSTMITFLKEWRYFVYAPKNINFTWEGDGQVKGDFDGISLPQFSSATVPKVENSPNEARCLDSDFVLNAGGLAWAMDWCPSNLEKPENSFRCEYLAVAAHPPGSTYHKIGVPLTGRGIIQIWCLLSLEENVKISPQQQRRPRGRPKNRQAPSLNGEDELPVGRPRGRPKGTFKNRQTGKDDLTVRRPRGRPKGTGKKILCPDVNNLNGNMESALPGDNLALSTSDLVPLTVNLGGTALRLPVSCALSGNVETLILKRRGRPSKKPPTSLNECVPVRENIVALPVFPDLNSNPELSVPRGTGSQVGKYDLTVRRPRGRPKGTGKKIPCPDVNNLNGNMVSALPGDNLALSTSELVPLSVNLGGISLGLPVSCALSGNVETLVPKRRGRRPSKKPPTSPRNEVESCEGMIEMEKSSAICMQEEVNITSGRAVAFDGTANQTLPVIHGNMLINTVASENCGDTVPVTNGADEGFSMDICEGPGAPTSAITRRKRRRTKDKERACCLKRGHPHLPTASEHNKLATVMASTNEDHYHGEMVLSKEMTEKKLCIPKDSTLPKVVLCLSHMGKVAWDVKWRPANINDSEDKQCLGYLAVLLGNGSLEVWEVPLLSMVKILYTSCCSDGTDPRFLKLTPIFRCSKVQCGDRQR